MAHTTKILAWAGALAASAAVAIACDSGFEVDPEGFCLLRPEHPQCASGASGAAGAGGVSGEGGGGAGGMTPAACDPAEVPDEGAGVFVDAAAPPGGAGTRAAPFASLAEAVAAVGGRAAATLYVRQGAAPYELAAPLALPALSGGLVLDGGWGANWARDCAEDAASRTVVRGASAAASPVLTAVGGAVTVRRLTVRTVDAAPAAELGKAGASLVAMSVGGATTLVLDAAELRAGKAGDGGAAEAAGAVTGARACNGRLDCQAGTSVTAPAGAGMAGVVQLTAAGYVAGDGGDGQPGGEGENGTRNAASDGTEDSECVVCNGADETTCNATSNLPVADQISADGKCGCGGKGGLPGRGGKGGGLSAALWVGGALAQVAVVGSRLFAGEGGNGSVGGGGGTGSGGVAGTEGLPICRALIGGTKCTWSAGGGTCNPFPFDSRSNTPGIAGGVGGTGGPGGPGGTGAGGPSYALLAPTGASVQVDAASVLMTGQGGLGGDGATRADAAPRKDY